MKVTDYLDRRTKNFKGEHPVKLLVYVNGQSKLVSTKCFLTAQEYAVMRDTKKRSIIVVRDMIDWWVGKAQHILEDMVMKGVYSWDGFKRRLATETGGVTRKHQLSLKDKYQDKIKVSKYKSARNFQCSLKALLEFAEKEDLNITEITVDFLNRFKKYQLSKGNTISTVYNYTRSLKTIMNAAVEDGFISKSSLPFGEGKFVIKKNHSRRAALEPEDIIKFWKYQPKSKSHQRAKDYWFLGLLTAMAPIDVAKLRKENIINDDRILFTRSKTLREDSEVLITRIKINPIVREIMERQGAKTGPFVFPILNSGMDEMEISKVVDQFCKNQRALLEKMRIELNITKSLSLYSARHSAADTLGFLNVNEKKSSAFLGQKRPEMVLNYMGEHRVEESAELQNMIIERYGLTRGTEQPLP